MKKFFLATLLAFMLSVQSLCSAAIISEAHFNGNDKLIYPVVHVADAAIDDKINDKIQTEIQSFVKQMQYAAQYEGQKIADMRTSYEIGSNESGGTIILSIVITKSNYYEGAAHPATVKHALNFNTSSGTLMGMNYLTEVGEGVSPDEFRNRIERALVKYCQREGIYLFDDALPLKQLPQEFYWDANLHIHFIFNHYDVAPYAAGIIDVDIDA